MWLPVQKHFIKMLLLASWLHPCFKGKLMTEVTAVISISISSHDLLCLLKLYYHPCNKNMLKMFCAYVEKEKGTRTKNRGRRKKHWSLENRSAHKLQPLWLHRMTWGTQRHRLWLICALRDTSMLQYFLYWKWDCMWSEFVLIH